MGPIDKDLKGKINEHIDKYFLHKLLIYVYNEHWITNRLYYINVLWCFGFSITKRNDQTIS